jgi:uncharacterized protein with PQ loop repeat
MIWTIIGISASTLTMFSFIPQIFRSLRTKSVKDVSPVTLFQLSSGAALWMIYGIARTRKGKKRTNLAPIKKAEPAKAKAPAK